MRSRTDTTTENLSRGLFTTASLRLASRKFYRASRFNRDHGQRSFDLHPDGERVAVAPELGSSDRPQDRLIFVFNFFDELRRIAAPTAKR